MYDHISILLYTVLDVFNNLNIGSKELSKALSSYKWRSVYTLRHRKYVGFYKAIENNKIDWKIQYSVHQQFYLISIYNFIFLYLLLWNPLCFPANCSVKYQKYCLSVLKSMRAYLIKSFSITTKCCSQWSIHWNEMRCMWQERVYILISMQ